MARRRHGHEIGLSHVGVARSARRARRYDDCFERRRTRHPGDRMRRLSIALALAASITSTATTQETDTSRGRPSLPRDIAREAARLYNEPAALRATDPTEIAEGEVVDGDVAVLNGPLTIA